MKLQIHWPLTGRTNFWVTLTTAILASYGPLLASSTYGDETNEAINHAKTLSRAFRAAAEGTIPSVVTIITKSKPDPDRIRNLKAHGKIVAMMFGYNMLSPTRPQAFELAKEEGLGVVILG